MERYEAYQPPKKKGFYLDPRTKVLFMAFVTMLMFFVYENIAHIGFTVYDLIIAVLSAGLLVWACL